MTAGEAAVGNADDFIDERRRRLAALQVWPYGCQGRVCQDELGQSQACRVDAAPCHPRELFQARFETSRLIGDAAREGFGRR